MAEVRDPTPEELEASKTEEQVLAEAFGSKFLSLSDDDAAQLSKVLFPETHIVELELLGIKRKLRPLPVKYAKAIFSQVRPLGTAILSGMKSPEVVDITATVCEALTVAASEIAAFYKWQDVQQALTEEEISLPEMQELIVHQQKLNGASDFLLGPLRVVIMVMQMHEVVNVKYRNLFTTQLSQKNGTVPSTNSLQSTPPASSP